MRATDALGGKFAAFSAIVFGAFGGLAMLLAFPGYNLWPGIYPGVASLFWMLLNLPGAAALLGTFTWSAVFMVPLIHWISISTASTPPWLALAGVQISWYLLWAIVAILARRRVFLGQPVVYSLFLVVTFVGTEIARAHAPWHGFAWGLVAYTQVDSPFASLIPRFGLIGISILVALIALAIALIISSISTWLTRLSAVSGVVVVFTIAAFVIPPYSSTSPGGQARQDTLTVAAVQGNVSRAYPADISESYRILRNSVQQTERTQAAADVYIWGEQSADIDPRTDTRANDLVQDAIRAVDAPILVGVVATKDGKRRNEYLSYSADGALTASYMKQRPVPFGEYMPAREFFAHLTDDVNQIPIDMIGGNDPAIMPVTLKDGRKVPLAVGICFEVSISEIMQQGIAHGGQLIVIPTNNASFGDSDESVQQLQMVRFRALEYHRAAVSASINGVSALIQPNGEVIAATKLFQAASITGKLPLHTDLTPAYYLQPYATPIVAGLAVVAALWALLGKRRKEIRI